MKTKQIARRSCLSRGLSTNVFSYLFAFNSYVLNQLAKRCFWALM